MFDVLIHQPIDRYMNVCTCGNWVPKKGYAERMKCLFKSKTRTPVELVQHLHDLLIYAIQDSDVGRERKREEKMSDLSKLILDLRIVLFGNGQTEPNSDACAHVTQEFFKMDTLHLLIVCLPKLDLGARQNSTHVIANLQRQRVSGRMIASDFMEKNLDIMDILIPGCEAGDIALTYGAISRECIRHQTVAKYVLESEHMKNFFSYIQIPNFDIASDAQATFKELLTRHKSTVAEFLSNNYEWFFQEYNSQLLESPSYITRRHAVKLLGDILLDRSNSAVMLQYISSLDNMRILMNLFRESKKSIQLETFHVFKLFVANQNKPPKIVRVLVKNRKKLLQFLAELKIDKEDEQFHADKAQVMKEIAMLDLDDRSSLCGSSCADSVDFEVEP